AAPGESVDPVESEAATKKEALQRIPRPSDHPELQLTQPSECHCERRGPQTAARSRLRASAPPRLRASAPPRLRASAPPRLRASAPPRLRASAPPRLRASAPPRLRALPPP